jgi:hypothetical protein
VAAEVVVVFSVVPVFFHLSLAVCSEAVAAEAEDLVEVDLAVVAAEASAGLVAEAEEVVVLVAVGREA